ARELLTDLVVELPVVGKSGDAELEHRSPHAPREEIISRSEMPTMVHVLPKPGVTDPVAASTLAAINDFGIAADAVVTLRKYWIGGLTEGQRKLLTRKLLAHDSFGQVVLGPAPPERSG